MTDSLALATAESAGLVDLTARATILLSLSLALQWLTRREPAAMRHRLWTWTFVFLLVLPASGCSVLRGRCRSFLLRAGGPGRQALKQSGTELSLSRLLEFLFPWQLTLPGSAGERTPERAPRHLQPAPSGRRRPGHLEQPGHRLAGLPGPEPERESTRDGHTDRPGPGA